MTPTLSRRKSGLPDLRKIKSELGQARVLWEREPTEFAAASQAIPITGTPARNARLCPPYEAAYVGAPARTSLYTIESISAWNEASMMLGETPTVVQRSPVSSSLSISTRVTASVPALRIRTR